MRSKIAEEVRDDLPREMLALPPAERIRRALALGDEDLRLFAAANGLTRAEASDGVFRARNANAKWWRAYAISSRTTSSARLLS